jgi:glycosyltransferase involved in cell wall biosynthesis
MKVLIISPRFPWPPHTGDRLRAAIWISALARGAEVSLVAPRGTIPLDAPPFRFFAAPRSLTSAARAAIALIREALPVQCLLAAPFDWCAALDRARSDAGPFDATVVLLARLHPAVRASIEKPSVLDAVDSLNRNAEERWKAARGPMRWLWRMEQRRMERLELEAARAYERVVVVSEDEIADFGAAVAVTNGIAAQPLAGAPRTFDFGFWGRLPYFANADAVQWLLYEIWPAIRALEPSATLVIGGAHAPRSLRSDAQRLGVTLVSPIDDVPAFARTIRVALMPLRYGSGQSNKILEAAEAGCAIAGTPLALRGLAPLAALARIESTARDFARAAVELLRDEEGRARLATRLRAVIESDYARSVTFDRLANVVAGVAAP